MKILVAVKRVIDYNVKIRIKSDQSGVETQQVKMSMNPFDEIALEEAIRFKEKGWASEVIVVSIGDQSCQETLRTALAMGADRAILLVTELRTDQTLQPLAVAKLLRSIVQQESTQLVLLGKQAIDSDNNQVGQMLAGLLNWPQGTFVSKIEVQGDKLQVVREVDGGLATLLLSLPAVITTDLRLNQPRYATLPNIMQAKKKPLAVLPVAELGVDITPQVKVLNVMAPPVRQGGIKVSSVAELVHKLHTEAKVI